MTYQLLLFDLDNTLFDFDRAQDMALAHFLKVEGVSEDDIPNYIQYYVPMNQKLWDMLELGLISRQDLVNQRFAKLFAHFGQDRDGVQLARHYQECLSQEGVLLEGARDLLEECRRQGKRIFAVSNGISYIQRNRIAQARLEELFEGIFISEEVGFVKPSLAYFDHVFQNIPDFDKSLAVMIGDSLSADIQGAIQAGLDSVWYNPHQKELPADIHPTYTVKNFKELKDLILA